jgi:hypothetical protein
MTGNGIDVRRVLESSTTKTTVQELARKGIEKVRVLDEPTLMNLIREAVNQTVSNSRASMSDEERERITQNSRQELENLIREHHEMKLKAEVTERDRQSLIREVENLTDQLRLTRRMMHEEAARRYEEGVQSQMPLLAELRRRLQEHESQRKNHPMLGDLQDRLDRLVEQDGRMATQVNGILTRLMEQLTRRIDSIRVKVGATPVEFKPGQATHDQLFNEELESNLSEVGVKSQTGTLNTPLDKLRSMRRAVTS